MLIYEVLKIRDFSKVMRLLFATPQKLLRDPPVGNHWTIPFRTRAWRKSVGANNEAYARCCY